MEKFTTDDGGSIAPEQIDGDWRLVKTDADGTRHLGKTRFASKADALFVLRRNSTRVN